MSACAPLKTGLEALQEAIRLADLCEQAIEKGDYFTAESLAQRALVIKESELGFDHPALSNDIFNVGLLCQAVGNHAEAFALLRRALAMEQIVFGSEHPSVLETQRALDVLLDELDDYDYGNTNS